MSYAYFSPKEKQDKYPLIIWLHGGGEGGTDPTVPLLANRAANYASDEIQQYFGGAYVLVPQSPTRWMDSGEGSTFTSPMKPYN
jgi:predicted peptidase